MSKLAVVGTLIGIFLLVGLAGGGVWWFLKQRNTSGHIQGSTSPSPSATSSSSTDSGLQVDSGAQLINLGQLTPDQENKSEVADDSPAPPQIDPATFGQYDEHKGDKFASFGELIVGSGKELTAGKKAAVYYKGWLTNGKLFEMSPTDKNGDLQPYVFTLGARQVIPGWEQGTLGMKEGGVRLVIVPPAVGYGAEGKGAVPGNAVMVFQLQLAAVE